MFVSARWLLNVLMWLLGSYLSAVHFPFWDAGQVGIARDNHVFSNRQGPHSGFAVRRGVYAGLVVGSTEHRGREKGRRSRGLATQTFPHWDKGNNSRSGQRRHERARVNLQATCE